MRPAEHSKRQSWEPKKRGRPRKNPTPPLDPIGFDLNNLPFFQQGEVTVEQIEEELQAIKTVATDNNRSTLADSLSLLTNLPDQSTKEIVIPHQNFSQAVFKQLFEQVLRVIKPGGKIIFQQGKENI